ncbi:hypothetical protein ACFLZP_03840 [Patescibacteria group bacterium]
MSLLKKHTKHFWKFIFGLGLVYLSLPLPGIAPLSESLRSDEPGDNVEISGVSAYYTNTSREEVLLFYQRAFSRSSFLSLPLPIITLNHPPEYNVAAIRDTVPTTFVYELVHPFRDSLIVSGYDPQEDRFLKSKAEKVGVRKNEQFFKRKVTLRLFQSSVFSRCLIFAASLGFLKLILGEVAKIIKGFKKRDLE